MNRAVTFLLFLLFPSAAFAQVPPGPPYDPARHVNPIITFVQAKDFKPSTYTAAQEAAGIQLMGLSKETGSLKTVELAEPAVDVVKELKLDVKATFYAVVRQTFTLVGGGELVLHSFKTPKIPGNSNGRFSDGFPPRGRNPKDKRFGPASPPEQLELRGTRGLLFEKDGTLTAFWQEEGITYTATASLARKAFFRILDDLL